MPRGVRVSDTPAVPSLRRLRDEAKRRRRSGEFATLAQAQYAIAAAHGFTSWPALKVYAETRAADASARAALLVSSACSSDIRPARVLLAAEPTLARHDLATACVTGEADEVGRRLAQDPAAVNRKLAPSGWEPLLYACFSRFLRASEDRARGIIEVVRILLAAGADPNVYWYDREFRELPIYAAAGIANSPELTRMLLAAGADPKETYQDPDTIGEALYHAVEFTDPTCARLLLEAGLNAAVMTMGIGRALNFPNPDMIDVLLQHGARPHGGHLKQAVYKGRPVRTVAALIQAGAPADEPDGDSGLTALRMAVRWGRTEVADVLIAAGADRSLVTAEDRAIGSLWARSAEMPPAASPSAASPSSASPSSASPSAAGWSPGLVPPPDLLDWAAQSGDLAAVRRLLAAGAAVDGTPDLRPMGQAAWRGHRDVVRELVTHGAQLSWEDDHTAIGTALHGSMHCHDPQGGPTMRTTEEVTHGDYRGVLQVLVDAGAPIPERLWDPDLDARDLMAAMGVILPRPEAG
jgi:ankyrin repeat protein